MAEESPDRPALGVGAQREFFERGWCVLPDVFSATEVNEMRAAFARIEATADSLLRTCEHRGSRFVLESAGNRVRIHRVVWCGAAEPVLLRYGADARLTWPAAELLGTRRMHHLINQAHFKRPGDAVAFPWHQDSTHRRYGESVWRDVNGRGSYVQTVTALDDMNAANGALRFIPGSSRFGHLGWDEDRAMPEHLARTAVTPEMSAGSVVLFGPYTLHASSANRTDRPRRAFINGYAFPGANSRVYPGTGSGRLLTID